MPLALGIAIGDRFPCEVPLWACAVAGLLPPALYGLYRRYALTISIQPHASHNRLGRHALYRSLFGSTVFLFLLLAGYTSASRQWRQSTFPYRARQAAVYRVRLTEKPQVKARSLLFHALLSGKDGDAEASTGTLPKPCLLYFPKDVAASTLRRGDELWIYARLAPPQNDGDTGTFDYARYLRRKGIAASGYVPTGRWRLIAHDHTRSLRQTAADWREQVVATYRRIGFEGDELAVLSALTVGYKETLDRELSDTYAVAGAAHVLAISGLHTGFLYALFLFLFAPLWRRWRALKIPLTALILLSLWGFALLTGLSTSVVRAAVMCSLSLLSLLQYHKPFTLNLLAAAAFGMLLVRPLWLFDVGFQLSFSAVGSIVWLQPKLYALWQPKHRPMKWLWSLLTLSLAAQMGTLPLTLLYFSRFPTYFLWTNLWVIPVVTLVLYGGVLLLALAPFPALAHPLAAMLQYMIRLQNAGLQRVGQLPYASIEGIHWGVVDVLLCYLCLYLSVRWLLRRTAADLLRMLAMVLLFLSWQTFGELWQAR